MIIPIFIPISTGQTIDYEVIKGILIQKIPTTLFICSSSGIINSNRNYSFERTQGEIKSRELCTLNALKMKSNYILMMDRDIILTDKNAILDMINVLDIEFNIGYVALWFGHHSKNTFYLPHMVILFMNGDIINVNYIYKGDTLNIFI